MVEAVSEHGYAGTSVRQVVGLAGVSRRSFYEQFANKEECFLATYDVIAARGLERIRAAHEACGGPLEDRLRAGFNGFTEGLRENWKGARLVIVEAQTAGPAGLARLRRTTAACEQLLSSSLAREPGGGRDRDGAGAGDRGRPSLDLIALPAQGR
jgi:AcrR family transcriptional regulator